MPNRFNSDIGRGTMPSGRKSGGSAGGGKKIDAPFTEKPAFPTMGAPGKTQSRDRSGGVRKVKQHPKSDGI